VYQTPHKDTVVSFDLGIWDKQLGLAPGIYSRLCEGTLAPNGESAAIGSFYDELTRRWPEIDSVPEERIGDLEYCPWSCSIERSGMHVIVNCVWPKADAVAIYVYELAAKHELVLYDPQADKIHLPKSAKKRGAWQPF
jgi:hypothetical protein